MKSYPFQTFKVLKETSSIKLRTLFALITSIELLGKLHGYPRRDRDNS
jgi:hypothetical protein